MSVSYRDIKNKLKMNRNTNNPLKIFSCVKFYGIYVQIVQREKKIKIHKKISTYRLLNRVVSLCKKVLPEWGDSPTAPVRENAVLLRVLV